MKLRSVGRFIGRKICLTGYFFGLVIWATDKFAALNFLHPTKLLEVPGIPHPSVLSYCFILGTMFFWARHQLQSDGASRRSAKGHFFFCLHLAASAQKGIVSLLSGIAMAALTAFAWNGSQGALHAFALSMLVIIQQSLMLALLLQLATSTKWAKPPRFALF